MNAVIYCRVSSRDQVDGTSLESQERACRDYADGHDLTVSHVFIEEGESAKFADRTQLLELLSYCKEKKRAIDVLLVWKVDRFARNVEDHYAIKAALRKVGVKVVSVTEPIQADPNGKLMETILAGFAQFDNDIRALRTIQGMQRRIQEGIFPWHPPLGYLPPRAGKKRQPDSPDPRRFSAIQKAWKFFATGAYTKADIVRLLRSWGIHGYRGQLVSPQLLDHMFRNQYYKGILRDPWTGTEYPGRHFPMVSDEEFALVQDVVARRSHDVESHHRIHESFPLRGLVRCPSCQHLMTGYYAKGRRKRYAYYQCFNRDCSTRTRTYAAAAVHEEFEQLLTESSVPHYVALNLLSEAITAHAEKNAERIAAAKRRRATHDELDRRLQELIDIRVAKLLSNDEFTRQRERLRSQMDRIRADQATESNFTMTADEMRQLTESLSDLGAFWRSGGLLTKRGLGRLMLPAGYVLQGVRTAEQGLLFRTIGTFDGRSSDAVPSIKDNPNTLIAEIRRLLAIIRHGRESYKQAA